MSDNIFLSLLIKYQRIKAFLKKYSTSSRFFNTFYRLLTKLLEAEFLKKNNTTGTNSFVSLLESKFRT